MLRMKQRWEAAARDRDASSHPPSSQWTLASWHYCAAKTRADGWRKMSCVVFQRSGLTLIYLSTRPTREGKVERKRLKSGVWRGVTMLQQRVRCDGRWIS